MSVSRQDPGAGAGVGHTNRRPPEQKVVGSNPVEGTTNAPVSRVETGASSFLPVHGSLGRSVHTRHTGSSQG